MVKANPLIILTPKKQTVTQARAKLPKPLRILTSLKTTAVLGVTLGVLLNPALALAGARTIGVTIAKKALASPVKAVALTGFVAGGGLGLVKPLFSTVKKATETTVPVITGKEELTSANVEDVAKSVGVALGLGAGAVVGGVVAKKVLEKSKDTVTALPSQVLPVAVSKGATTGGLIAPVPPTTPQTVSLDTPTPSKKAVNGTRQTNKQQVSVIINSGNKRYSVSRKSVKYLNPVIQL